MRKRISQPLLLLLATLALLWQGCSGGLFKTPEPVEITFVFPAWDQSFYTPLLQAYQEQNPGQTVVPRPEQDEQQVEGDVEVVSLLGGVGGEQSYRSLEEIIAAEKDLDPEDWYPGALQAFQTGGQMYAIPYGLDPFVLFYNQDLIDRLGLTAPQPGWSWDDFLALAQALTSPEAGTYGYAPAYGEALDATLFVYQRGGRLFDPEGRPTLNEPQTIAALDWYARLYTEHGVTLPYGKDAYGAHEAGKVGMWIGLFSMRAPAMAEMLGLKYSFGVSLLPAGEQQTTIALFEGYAISTKAEKPTACWKLIRFLLDHPNPRLVPARRSLAESEAYRDLVGEQAARTGLEAVSRALRISQSQLTGFIKISVLFNQAAEQVLSGQKTAEEALQAAQAQAEGE